MIESIYVFLMGYWPYILAILSLILGVAAAMHVIMTKNEVRTAIGWVALIIFSPILGAIIYFIIGINRIHRQHISVLHNRAKKEYLVTHQKFDVKETDFGDSELLLFNRMANQSSRFQMTQGNQVDILVDSDQTYEKMLTAIAKAQKSIFLETYIFDRGGIGKKFVAALAAAVARGVAVRVLIDAVGARYSIPSVFLSLRKYGIKASVFNGNIIFGLRLPYANLRTHRKILIIDGQVAFTGGMNISSQFCQEWGGKETYQDTHFCVQGPVVRDLFQIVLEDWSFATGKTLSGPKWKIPKLQAQRENMFVRVVPSGPDDDRESNHRVLIGAFSLARRHIFIATPYFLPDQEFISALMTAARRGVSVNIVLPHENNLKLVGRAMFAQFHQLITQHSCRLWLTSGAFNHSKLISIDEKWAFVGSSNLDSRSFRLNFEADLEIIDADFAKKIEKRIKQRIKNAVQITQKFLDKQSFLQRFINRLIWLGSPYL